MCSIFNGSAMICQMPVFQVPLAFFESDSTTESNNTANRKRRETHLQPSFQKFQPSSIRFPIPVRDRISEKMYNTQNLYAQSTWDKKPHKIPLRRVSRSTRPDFEIYLGFILNNYPKYQHLNQTFPDIPEVLFARPSFSLEYNKQQQEYDSSKEEPLEIQGRNLALVCSINDYDVSVGMGKCNVSLLTDNYLQCSPPKKASAPDNLTASFCSRYGTDYLPVMVRVGNSPLNQNFAFCVRYKSNDDGTLWWIGVCVGVAVGFVILLVVVAVAIAIHKKRKIKAKTQVTRHNRRPSNTESIDVDSLSSHGNVGPFRDNHLRHHWRHHWSNFNPESVTPRNKVSKMLSVAPFLSHAMRHSYTRQYEDARFNTEQENNAHQLDRRYDESAVMPRIGNDYRRTVGSENSRRILEADVGSEY